MWSYFKKDGAAAYRGASAGAADIPALKAWHAWSWSETVKRWRSDKQVFSWFETTFTDGTKAETFIEPLVAHLRHPLACGNTFRQYGADRSYIRLPTAPEVAAALGTPPKFKSYYFDGGSSDWFHGIGGPSLAPFVALYRRVGIHFSHLACWECTTPVEAFYKSVPAEYKHIAHYQQQCIGAKPSNATTSTPANAITSRRRMESTDGG